MSDEQIARNLARLADAERRWGRSAEVRALTSQLNEMRAEIASKDKLIMELRQAYDDLLKSAQLQHAQMRAQTREQGPL